MFEMIDGHRAIRVDRRAPYYLLETGQVWNEKRKKYIKPQLQSGLLYFNPRYHPYIRISITKEVATHFVENPNNYKHVRHLDDDKTNNHYTNLKWMSRRRCDLSSTQICCYNKEGEFVRGFHSIYDATQYMLCSYHGIYNALQESHRTCVGHAWRYWDGRNKASIHITEQQYERICNYEERYIFNPDDTDTAV